MGIRIEDQFTANIKNVDDLKSIGLELLQNLSGDLWTDYNIHDPGITTLEILCYVITELGYRADTSIEDIFNTQEVGNTSFYQAHEVLNSGAATLSDLKKIILDLNEIRNVEIILSPYYDEYTSLHTIWIELMSPSPTKEEIMHAQAIVLDKVNSHRFLGMAIDEVKFLNQDLVGIDLDIELKERVTRDTLLKLIIQKVDQYFSPLPSFKSIDELIGEGYSSDQIFDGPNLINGFLTEDNLVKNKIKKQLYISDLIHQVMDIAEVRNIKKILIKDKVGKGYNWVYKVAENCVPRLDLNNSIINVYFQNSKLYSFSTNPNNINYLGTKTKAAHKRNTLEVKPGRRTDLKTYRSLQYDFPAVYGVGELGPPNSWEEEKKAYSKQFKSYLSFFDQVLANYFAQLSSLPSLFSLNNISSTTAVQWLDEIPKPYHIFKPFLESYLLKNVDIEDEGNLKKEWIKWIDLNKEKQLGFLQETIESKAIFHERRKKVLDHLLARFGYDFSNFDSVAGLNDEALINHKLNTLRVLPTIGVSKYYGPLPLGNSPSDLYRTSGFKLFIMTALGFRGRVNNSISGVMKKIMLENNQAIALNFENVNLSYGIRQLFKFGVQSHNFKVVGNSILLTDALETEICSTNIKDVSVEPQEYIGHLTKSILNIDAQSENFYVFDHILLRPSEELFVFGFVVTFKGANVFQSPLSLSKREQVEEKNFFCEHALNVKKYSIHEVSHNQFKIQFQCKGSFILSVQFYESEMEAEGAIESYLSYFSELPDLKETLVATTKYNHIYNELQDPFSNILTVVLPDWASRFQNKPFKKHITNTIIQEAPANVFVNVKWVNYEELIALEEANEHYVRCSIKEKAKKEETLEQLLLLLMDNE